MHDKTNAARILDQLDISYELEEYPVDKDHQGATHTAEILHIPEEKIYKTLVLKGNVDSHLVAVIPSAAPLDLKKLAAASGNKKCEMILMKDLKAVTGYIRGGCSPLGMKRRFPTFIEELGSLEDDIYVSAGKRGKLLRLNPHDLRRAANAEFADLIG